MWTLNLGTGTKEEAAREALAVQAALGDRLHSFEIGNEVENLKRFDGYASYHAAYLDYKAAIRAALPAAVFSGPDVAGNVEWSVSFAQSEAKDMKLLIHHYYRGGEFSRRRRSRRCSVRIPNGRRSCGNCAKRATQTALPTASMR